jgi:hypothetical protein
MAPRYQALLLLAKDWMQELARVGLLPPGWKEPGQYGYPPEYTASGYPVQVRMENGQMLLLVFNTYQDDPSGDGRWFWRTEVRSVTSRTDRAILAALMVLEGGELVGKPPKAQQEILNRIRRALGGQGDLLEAGEEKLLAFARVLLWHYRPDLDQESDNGTEMMVEVCKRVVEGDARRLANFLEFGTIGRDTRPKIEDAQMDVYAAELRHFTGMSWPEIAKKLRLDVGEQHKKRSAAMTASQRATRGVALFVQALGGEDKWQRFADIQRRQYQQG